MASNLRGKYTLRGRIEADDLQDVQTEFDSEIDENEGEDEDDDDEDNQPLINFVDDELGDEISDPHDRQADVTNQQQQQPTITRNKTAPPLPKDIPIGWDSAKWTDEDTNFTWMDQFTLESKITIDIPDDADEEYFFSLFVPDELFVDIITETNRYAKAYIDHEEAANKLPPRSRFRLWPENGVEKWR